MSPKIIYKQQHVGDNGRKFSPSRNAHYVKYIGQREHVLKKSERSENRYEETHEHVASLLKYMGEREHVAKAINKKIKVQNGSLIPYDADAKELPVLEKAQEYFYDELQPAAEDNGLFGYIGGKFSDNYRMDDMQAYVRRISDNRNVFHSIFSFTPESAEQAGLETLEDWENWVKYHINDIAKNMNLKIENIEYLASVHLKKGQPHVHIEWWDKEQRILINKVDPKVCDAIRIDAIKGTYKELFTDMHNTEDKLTRTLRDKISAQTNSVLTALTPDNYITTIAKAINHIGDIIPRRGQTVYKLMPPNVKDKINNLTHYMIDNNPEFAGLYNEILTQRRLYNEMLHSDETNWGKYNLAKYKGRLNDDIESVVGNAILKIVIRERKAGKDKMIAALDSEPIPQSDETFDNLGSDNAIENNRDEIDYEYGKLKIEKKSMADNARYYLAKQLIKGDVVNRDVAAAIALLNDCPNNPYAAYALAKLYFTGDGVRTDYREAENYLLSISNNEIGCAEHMLGKIYSSDDPNVRNIGKAINSFMKAANHGEADAAYRLSVIFNDEQEAYYNNESSNEYLKLAITLYTEKAETNDMYAAFSLGRIFADKACATYNTALAEKWLKLTISSTEKCVPAAEYALAKLYMSDDVKRYTDALELLQKSFDHGNNNAAFAAAKLLTIDDTSLKNYAAAEEWLNRAISNAVDQTINDNTLSDKTAIDEWLKVSCLQPDAITDFINNGVKMTDEFFSSVQSNRLSDGEYMLAKLFLNDGYVDYKKSEEHLRRASAFQNPYAMYALAKLYLKGDIPKQPDLAKRLLENAITLDDNLAPFAYYSLGAMYLFDDTMLDKDLAVKYLTLSAQAGNDNAQVLLDNTENWKKNCVANLLSATLNILEGNSLDGSAALSDAAVAIFGRGDLSKEQIAELIYKLQDKQNTAEM